MAWAKVGNIRGPASPASIVTVDPSGLIVVTSTNVQAALAQLDTAIAAAGSPTGPAGGALSGNYPNPGFANQIISDTHVSVSAAISESKLALASDAVATTASRRTIGQGAQQAASGVATPLKIASYWWCPQGIQPQSTANTDTLNIGAGNNIAYYVAFEVDRAISVDAYHLFMPVAGAGNLAGSIYNRSLTTGAPTSLVAGSGVIAATAANGVVMTLGTAVQLAPGRYWLSSGFYVTTAMTVRVGQLTNSGMVQVGTNNPGRYDYAPYQLNGGSTQNTDPAAPSGLGGPNYPLMLMRVSSMS